MMIIVRRPRKLLHWSVKVQFGISLIIFLWYLSMFTFPILQQRTLKHELYLDLALDLRDVNTNVLGDAMSEKIRGDLSYDTAVQYVLEDTVYDNIEIENETDHYQLSEKNSDSAEINGIGVRKEGINKTERSSISASWLSMAKKQNDLYTYPLVRKIKTIEVFYLSAIRNAFSLNQGLSGDETFVKVAINGWQSKKSKSSKLFCCFKTKDKVVASEVTESNGWDVPDIKVVSAMQFMCNVSYTNIQQQRVGLSHTAACKGVEYIEVEEEMKPPTNSSESFAVCGKVVYGNYSAARLLEWIEVNREFGVDHISLFVYNVTKAAMTVLNHYRDDGFLRFKEFDFPLKMKYPRHIGQKYIMAYTDEQVAVFDCVQRFRRYTYIAIIDVDEFIVPKLAQKSGYKHMMTSLMKERPRAAGFTLMTTIFVLDWPKTYPEADFTLGQYTQRTQAIWDRRKSIILPERVPLQSVWTHGFHSKNTYNRVYIHLNKAMIYHYRKCRQQWIDQDTCYNNRRQYVDITLKKFISKFRDGILQKRQMLLHY